MRLEVAMQAAKKASKLIMDNYCRSQEMQLKSSDIDLVTETDIASNNLIRNLIASKFPEDLIITEEEPHPIGDIPKNRGVWLIDPLDGTANFYHGYPYFGVSIAYLENGQPQIAVVWEPTRDTGYWAIKGEGAFGLNQKLHVSAVDTLSNSLLGAGFPYDFKHRSSRENNGELFLLMMQLSRGVRRAASTALDLAYVASGKLDGFWTFRVSPWDVAAGMLLVEEAGGTISTLTNKPLTLDKKQIYIVASNSKIHQELVAQTSQYSAAPSLQTQPINE
jgi:myo-inositol-1(or 4)-monophosphatase